MPEKENKKSNCQNLTYEIENNDIQEEQTTYVASGCFEVTIGQEKKVLRAGDGYYVAPNLEHGCVCLEAGVLIDTFTPMREDFLKK